MCQEVCKLSASPRGFRESVSMSTRVARTEKVGEAWDLRMTI
jgi:hypothetical protein